MPAVEEGQDISEQTPTGLPGMIIAKKTFEKELPKVEIPEPLARTDGKAVEMKA